MCVLINATSEILCVIYNNSHCQAHLLADLLTIPLMYNLVLWNSFLKKKVITPNLCLGLPNKTNIKPSVGLSGLSHQQCSNTVDALKNQVRILLATCMHREIMCRIWKCLLLSKYVSLPA